MKIQKLFDVPITIGKYDHFINEIIQLSDGLSGSYVCLLNAHMMIEAQRKTEFRNVIEEADLVAPDGKPITWALKLLNDISQDRVAGMDILPDLLEELQKNNKSVFFYGGNHALIAATNVYVKKEYPNLIVSGSYAPPFRPLTIEETRDIVEKINDSGAKVIFIVLGCPKQEIWMASMKNKINAVMIGIGGALPVVIGSRKRAPKWMQKNGLEWLFRFIQEPRRLFKRYTVTNSWFLYLLLKAYLKKISLPANVMSQHPQTEK